MHCILQFCNKYNRPNVNPPTMTWMTDNLHVHNFYLNINFWWFRKVNWLQTVYKIGNLIKSDVNLIISIMMDMEKHLGARCLIVVTIQFGLFLDIKPLYFAQLHKQSSANGQLECVGSSRLIKTNDDAGDHEETVADAKSVLTCLQV